ncbi:MAG: ribbon-helix-helix protein, CopG family [Clostridia bacterium]|nr:ribbon-helix-helix protein, CopG family [Clostridia bacterium]
MTEKFVLKVKNEDKVIMTIRLERELQERFDQLAALSDRSRNEVVVMALRYALDHLELVPNEEND